MDQALAFDSTETDVALGNTASKPVAFEIWQTSRGAWVLESASLGGIFATRADALRWADQETGGMMSIREPEAASGPFDRSLLLAS